MNATTRRRFIQACGLGGVAPFSKVLGANGDIRLAIVGVGSSVKIGGKGKQEIGVFSKIPGVRIVALCDPEHAHLDPEVQKFKDRNEPCEAYTDVRRLLENKDIDAICVTTPNHWHSLATIWACQAGKDVYCQKPFSHNVFEGRKAVEAAQKYNRVVAATHGPRTSNSIRDAYEWVHQGNLGEMLYVQGIHYRPRISIGKVDAPQPIPKTLDYDLWSGPAPIVPPRREFLHYDWHWIWAYGDGDIGNNGVHYVDSCRWALQQQTLPERVVTIGGRFGYDDDGETPNTLITFYDYRPVPMIFEVRGLPKRAEFLNQNWEKNSTTTMDSYLQPELRVGVVIKCEGGYLAGARAFDNKGTLIKEFKSGNSSGNVNFLEVMRSRKNADLQANALDGHLSASLVHLANISYRLGKETSTGQIREIAGTDREFADSYSRLLAHLDANEIDIKKHPITLGPFLKMDPKREKFTGAFADRANPMLTREYRKPFVVPEKV
ncbi:MAG: Gfo/Idh/MocA family oxidoreductase [Acidobacteriia bacterium]|nr:Gfo/Idh/MocA family oxidoreductase [Terriglobia bacterium]